MVNQGWVITLTAVAVTSNTIGDSTYGITGFLMQESPELEKPEQEPNYDDGGSWVWIMDKIININDKIQKIIKVKK